MIWLWVCIGVAAWVVLAGLIATFLRGASRLDDELLEEDVEAALHPLGNVRLIDEHRRTRP